MTVDIDIKEKEGQETNQKKRSFSANKGKEKKDMVTSTITFSTKFREHISNFAKENSYGTLQAVVEDALKKLMKSKNYNYEE